MREEYIALAKKHILETPDFHRNSFAVKEKLRLVGVNDAEFEAAVQQLNLPVPVSPANPPPIGTTPLGLPKIQQTLSRFIATLSPKKLLELDIVLHCLVLGFVVLAAGFFLLAPRIGGTKVASEKTPLPNQQTVKTTTGRIPQVYASSKELDAQRAFSYPASDVTLKLTGVPKKEIYGFFPYWMIGMADKINLTPLTRIALFGLEMDGGGNIVTTNDKNEPDGGWAMWNDPALTTFIRNTKRKNIKVEVTLKMFNSRNIEKLVTSDEAQKVFISNALHLINLKSLDGINLDFEYIGTPTPAVQEGFTRFVVNLRTEMKRQVPNSSLTIDTYVSEASIPRLVNLQAVAESIDAFVVMGYDISTPNGNPGPISPLDGSSSLTGFMQSYLEKVPAEKIILALPWYGYDWPIDLEGVARKNNSKILPYAELAEVSKAHTLQWDEVAQSPWYSYIDSETKTPRVVHFENVRSLGVKFDYINNKNFKGVGIWALGYDGLNADLSALLIEKFAK